MTLNLRSDARAINHLGGAHGFDGPLDYVAMLDFSRGEYFRLDGGNRVNMTLSDAVSVSRESVGVVRRPDMSLYTVPAHTPRISFNSRYGMQGLLVEKALTNLVTAPDNGGTVTIPNVSGRVLLSFIGGDVSLSHASLTLEETYEAEGRTCKLYNRTSGTISATMSVSGGAVDIQAVIAETGSGSYQGNFLGYGGIQAQERVALGSDIVGLLAGGDFTIVQQVVMNTSGGLNALNGSQVIRAVSGTPFGGCLILTSRNKSGNGTDNVRTAVDGSAVNTNTVRAALNGTWNDLAVFGLACRNRGDDVGIISYGQYNSALGLGPQFGPIDTVYIGGSTAGQRVGGIITRCVVYDRMLTDDEAWVVANTWR